MLLSTPSSRATAAGLVAVALLALACDHAEQAASSPSASPTALPDGVSPVQNEMRLLHEAMQGSVTAVANDDLGAIPHALHRVHQARGMTEAAIEDGSYRPPRNGEDVEGFVRMDEAFHHELEQLVRAARSGDSAATGQQIGVVLSRCSGCHERFRPPPAAPPRHDTAHAH